MNEMWMVLRWVTFYGCLIAAVWGAGWIPFGVAAAVLFLEVGVRFRRAVALEVDRIEDERAP